MWLSFPLLTHYNTQAWYTNSGEFITQEDDNSLFKSHSCSTCSSLSPEDRSVTLFICNANPTMPRSNTSKDSNKSSVPPSTLYINNIAMANIQNNQPETSSLQGLGCL